MSWLEVPGNIDRAASWHSGFQSLLLVLEELSIANRLWDVIRWKKKKKTREETDDNLPVGGAAYRIPRKLVTPSSRLRSDWYVAYPRLTTFNGVDGAARATQKCWLAIAKIEKNRDNTAIILWVLAKNVTHYLKHLPRLPSAVISAGGSGITYILMRVSK